MTPTGDIHFPIDTLMFSSHQDEFLRLKTVHEHIIMALWPLLTKPACAARFIS